MRRTLFTSFATLLLVMGATNIAHAAPPANCNTGGGQVGDMCCDNNYCDNTQGLTCNTTTYTCTKTAAATTASDAAAQTPTDPIGSEGYNSVIIWIMKLFAWLVGVAAITLDNAVYYTVVTMGDYVKNLTAVGVAWRILRDIGNIALIFGFLAIGINIILGTDAYGWGKSLLPKLLFAAVALNFSLFVTEAVIDGGNLLATQFYTQINGGKPAGAKNFDLATVSADGISNKIMAQVGLQNIYNAGQVKTEVFKAGNTWVIGFMSIILFIITAFVMFSLAFILIARFVALIFIIILAPIGVVGFAVPRLSDLAKKWRNALFDNTISAPILLLLLYIALAIITDVHFLTGFGGKPEWTGFIPTTAGVSNLTGFASMLLSFLVAMGLLLAVTMYAKKLSGFGTEWATKTAGKLTFGATAMAGRSSGGWLANKGANLARRTAIGRVPILGAGLVRGLDRVAGASFDVRGTSALKNFPGGSVDAGAAKKGGYKADLKARTEAGVKYAKDLKGRELTSDEKLEQSFIQKEIKDLNKEVTASAAAWVAKKRDVDDKLKKLKEEGKTLTTEEFKARERAINEEMNDVTKALTNAKKAVEEKEGEFVKLESVTDKGAQRKYAKILTLGLKDDNLINKYFNFTANTEAAKKIRSEAKKSANDKTLDAIKKVVEKEDGGGEEKKIEKEEPKPKAGE